MHSAIRSLESRGGMAAPALARCEPQLSLVPAGAPRAASSPTSDRWSLQTLAVWNSGGLISGTEGSAGGECPRLRSKAGATRLLASLGAWVVLALAWCATGACLAREEAPQAVYFRILNHWRGRSRQLPCVSGAMDRIDARQASRARRALAMAGKSAAPAPGRCAPLTFHARTAGRSAASSPMSSR